MSLNAADSDRTGTVSRAAFAGYGHEVTASERAAWRDAMSARAQEAFHRGQQLIAHGRLADGVFWLGRAERLARNTPNVSFAYATAALANGQIEACLVRVQRLKAEFGLREAAFIEPICFARLGDVPKAVAAMGWALARYHASSELHVLAQELTKRGKKPGWCTLSNSGVLLVEAAGPVTLALDGQICHSSDNNCFELPENWQQAERLDVRVGRRHVLGSPVDIRSITRCESLVWPEERGVSGWIWHPAEPDFVPCVTVDGLPAVHVEAYATDVDSEVPLSRPRSFHFAVSAFQESKSGLLMIRDGNGRPLTGAPLRPALGRLLAGDLHLLPVDLRPRPVGNWPKRASSPRVKRDCAVVIPVYRDKACTLACLRSVLDTVAADVQIVVVEDATPERDLEVALDEIAQQDGRIILLRNSVNLGFPASANRGMREVRGRDVVLLNSDTLVPSGWLERLIAWLDLGDVGTATPFSNDASILSYPSVTVANDVPSPAQVRLLDKVCQQVSSNTAIELPTANGFCMAIAAECLEETGYFREDLFAQGYGEENDFSLRASAKGFRHVAATDLYVGHVGSASFGSSRRALMARNLQTINALHPGYDEYVAAFIALDPLADMRRNIDIARLQKECGRRSSVLLVQHDAGGGVGRVVRERAEAFEADGLCVVAIRPTSSGCGLEAGGKPGSFPALKFDLPSELPLLLMLLRSIRVQLIEWHHLVGHASTIRHLHTELGVPYEIFIHDHVWFCPRISLLDGQGRYCGEPDVVGCVRCIDRWGSYLGEDITVPQLLKRSRTELSYARRLMAPTHDTARRLERHFPGLAVDVTPLENDAALSMLPKFPVKSGAHSLKICVVGGISRWKGFDFLLAVARDVRKRGLPIEFVLVGHSPDDDALISNGIAVTGEYQEQDVGDLIKAQSPDLGFISSIAPETWCYALSQIWRAGLDVVCFDLGAQGERVRQSGRGAVFPLGVPPEMFADLILRYWRNR